MMKKKSTDTEEKKESGQTKHSDNKDNSTILLITRNPQTGDENDRGNRGTQTADAEQEPDKVSPKKTTAGKTGRNADRYLRLSRV